MAGSEAYVTDKYKAERFNVQIEGPFDEQLTQLEHHIECYLVIHDITGDLMFVLCSEQRRKMTKDVKEHGF